MEQYHIDEAVQHINNVALHQELQLVMMEIGVVVHMRIHQQIKPALVQQVDDVLQQVMDEAVQHINNVVLHQELQNVTTEVGAILHMIIHQQIKPALVQHNDDVLQQPMDEVVFHTNNVALHQELQLVVIEVGI